MPTNQKIILENDIILSKTEKHPIVNVGGITTEDNIANMTVKDILNEMLFPYIAPEIKGYTFSTSTQYKNNNDGNGATPISSAAGGNSLISDFYNYSPSIKIDGHGNNYIYKLWARKSSTDTQPSQGADILICDNSMETVNFNIVITNDPTDHSNLKFNYRVSVNNADLGDLSSTNKIVLSLWLYDSDETVISHSDKTFTNKDQYIYGSVPVNYKYNKSNYQACSGKQGTFNTKVTIPAFNEESYMFFAIPKSQMLSTVKNSITMVADQGQFEQTWNILTENNDPFNLEINKYINTNNTNNYRIRDYYIYLSDSVNKSDTAVGFTYKS